jgi:outer membrane receptor for ferrienterochelin and colicins
MGPRLRTFAGSLLLVLAAGPVRAQSGAIVGRVTAADGGTPVSTALVEAVVGGRTSGQATSDAVGQYRIGGLQPGTYTVIVTTVGYNVQSVENVAVPAGGSVTADVALAQTVFTLPGIAATGSRDLEKITDTPANVSVVSERDVRETPTVTPVDHLRSLPAVDIITSGVRSRNVVVRGFNNIFSGALHTLTDHRIAGVPSLRVNFLHFTPQSDEDIERMEVVLGPGSALYGPNTANGVLHIMTKSPLQDPSTVVTISGGEQDLFQGTFRTAHALSERFGFKVSGEYLRAQEWDFRDSGEDSLRTALDANPASAAVLFPPSMSAEERTRRAARIGNRDFDITKWAGDIRADWRATDRLTTVFSAGVTNNNGIELTGIGAGQAVDWKYMYAQARATYGRLFAQTYVNASDAGETILLRNGAPITDKSRVWVSQLQHGMNVGTIQRFTYGADFVQTMPITEGTISGRNEDDDKYTEVGAYLQSNTALHRMLDVVLAARVDKHSELPDAVFSPRAALVFKPVEGHALRATYNRAFSTPTSLNLFLDIDAGPLGALGPFGFRAHAQAPGRAGILLHADDGSLQIRTPFASTNPADAQTLRDPTASAIYGYQVEALMRANPALAGLRPFLLGFRADPAFAQIARVLLDPLTSKAVLFDPAAVRDVPGIEESTTSTIEFGYKGLLANRLMLAADVWWSKHKNFTSPLIASTPLVLMNPQQLVPFLVPRLTPIIMATNPTLTPAQAQAQATAIAMGMARLPGGIVSSAAVSGQGPTLAVTYINFGEVDLSGVDLAATAILSDLFQLGVTGSLVSDDFFQLPIGDRDTTVVALNAPKKKGSASLTFRHPDAGVNALVRVRYTDEFPANSANFVGLQCVDPDLQGKCVKSYTLVDLTAGYQLPMRGASVQLTVSNILDEEYQSFIGVPVIGRMAMLRLRYEFGGSNRNP